MLRKLKFQLALAFLLVGLMLPVFPGLAAVDSNGSQAVSTAPWAVPEGFETLISEPAVTLYRKNYPNGTPDYVQVVLLSQGAVVDLLHGQVAQARPGKGIFGGNDASFNLESLKGFWAGAVKASDSAFCVVNGSFFYMPETPTRLPFSLKVDGTILTDGYGQSQYPELALMLELWPDRADIRPLTAADLNQSSAPDILGGLAAEANKRAKYAVGRTFVGVQDRDADGVFETLYILSSQTHTQSGADKVLKDFGAEKVMMLDGGGSTQLACQGKEYIATGRLIPQGIAVFAAQPGGLEAKLLEAPEKLSSGLQETIVQDWTLENSGELAWLPGEHRLILEAGPYWEEQQFSPQEVVQPGQKLQFRWELPAFPEAGSYALSMHWYLSGAGRRSEIQQHDQALIVLGSDPASQNSGATPAAQWQNPENDQSQGLSADAQILLESERSGQAEKISLRDLLMVPAIVLPLGLLLFVFFSLLRG